MLYKIKLTLLNFIETINILIPNKFKRTAWWLIFTNLGFFGLPIGVFILFLMWLQNKLLKYKTTIFLSFIVNLMQSGVFIGFTILVFLILATSILFVFVFILSNIFLAILFISILIALILLLKLINTSDKFFNLSNKYKIIIIFFIFINYIFGNLLLFIVAFDIIIIFYTKYFLKYILFISINIFLLGIISNIVFYSYKFSKKSITDDKH